MWLNIYDIGTSGLGSGLNWMLAPLGTGAFHCGVEVYGWEWSYSDINASMSQKSGLSGMFRCAPRSCESHSYSQSVQVGLTTASRDAVSQMISMMEREWPVEDYDLLLHNCCHFSDTFCRQLGVGGIPTWMLSLAGAGAELDRRKDQVVALRCCGPPEGGRPGCCPGLKGRSRAKAARVDDEEVVQSNASYIKGSVFLPLHLDQ